MQSAIKSLTKAASGVSCTGTLWMRAWEGSLANVSLGSNGSWTNASVRPAGSFSLTYSRLADIEPRKLASLRIGKPSRASDAGNLGLDRRIEPLKPIHRGSIFARPC